MIESFQCSDTEMLFYSRAVPRFKNIERVARRKLLMLSAATVLDSLRVPPGNRLEALAGERKGQYSIRINDQWRICFRWLTIARAMLKLWITIKGRKMDGKLPEIHPGEILLEEFLKPMGITNARLASDIDVPTSRISEIINGKRPITVDTAMRLSVYFGMEARFWLNLQAEYDVRMAEANLLPEIKSRIRPLQMAV